MIVEHVAQAGEEVGCELTGVGVACAWQDDREKGFAVAYEYVLGSVMDKQVGVPVEKRVGIGRQGG